MMIIKSINTVPNNLSDDTTMSETHHGFGKCHSGKICDGQLSWWISVEISGHPYTIRIEICILVEYV